MIDSDVEILEEQARQREEAINASFGFRAVVASLRRGAAMRSMMRDACDVPISDASANLVSDLAARLALFASSETTTRVEHDLAKALVETTWRHTPILAFRDDGVSDSEPRYVHRFVPNTDPWHIVLTLIFQAGRFLAVLLPHNDHVVTAQRRGRHAVGMILSELDSAWVELPAPLPDTIENMKATNGGHPLPEDVAARVDAAATFLQGLVGAPLPAPYSGFDFRVRLDGLGGKGDGARLSPWGAAAEFARRMGCPAMRPLEDAVRLKTPQSPR